MNQYHNCILYKITGMLIVMSLVVGCSSVLSPTAISTLVPTETPIPTPTPVPTVTPSPTAEPPTSTPTTVPIPVPSAEGDTYSTELTRNIEYAKVDYQPTRLDVYAPSQEGPWPVVIVAPGFRQTKIELDLIARAITAEGAVVFNTDLAFIFPFLTGIERLACAVRFARAYAPDYGGDPNRIIIVGNSAGAASGLVVGLAGDDFERGCVVSDGSALPDALVAFEGPYEFATTNYNSVIDHTQLPEILLETIDPYSHIGRNPDLHVRLIHGEDVDDLWYEITPEESIKMHQALVDAGYDVELFMVDGATHLALSSKSEVFTLTIEQVMELASSLSQ